VSVRDTDVMSEHADGFLIGATTWLYGGGPPAACPDCGYDWATPPQTALELLAGAPDRYSALLDGRDGMAPVADGGWNATAFVWHLVDMARSWAERWVQIEHAPGALLVGWDPDEMAAARNYRALPTAPALWALDASTRALVERTRVVGFDAHFLHGQWGSGSVGEATRWIAHEFFHHEGDVAERVL
jgi:hypothetical protein